MSANTPLNAGPDVSATADTSSIVESPARAHGLGLAALRRASNLTQAEVARRMGVKQPALSGMEGRDDLLLSTLASYLGAVGATRVAITAEINGESVTIPVLAADQGVHWVYRLRPAWTPRYQPDVYVPGDLGVLTGPTNGRCDPPVNLYWQPGELDFADRGDMALFYSSALTSASTLAEFSEWINRETLVSVWGRLSLPGRVRDAWQTLHPSLREDDGVNDRIRIQDTILTAVADYGFALAGGSALIDYDVVARETDDIDAFNDRWDVGAFRSACVRVVQVCAAQGWDAVVVADQDMDKKIRVDAGTGIPVVVQLVYYGRSRDPETRAAGGLRLVFEDVVGGKGAAVADSARGRDFFDLASIVDTPGWSLERVEASMQAIKFGDLVEQFRNNLDRFRRGEFDDDIEKSGFDAEFCHRMLD